MVDWRPILHPQTGRPLLNESGIPKIYDADKYPNGPPAGCCCEELPCCGLDGSETIFGTITNKTGDAVELPTNISASGDGVTLNYRTGYPGTGFGTPCNGGCYLVLRCNNGNWEMPSVASCFSDGTLVSASCSPFQLVFDVTFNTGFCHGSIRVTWTL